MKQARQMTMALPQVEADGNTHRRDCECARCEAGFRPGEAQRAAAAVAWEEQERRKRAIALLETRREKRRLKALTLQIELQEEARRTAAALQAQREEQSRMKRDPRLEALLASRLRGHSANDAVALVERSFAPGAAVGGGRRP